MKKFNDLKESCSKELKDVSSKTLVARKNVLKKRIEKKLPNFAKALKIKGPKGIVLHQDAFAGDFQPEEYVLLGMAVKYAGLFGKEFRVFGKCGETIERKK